MSPVVPLAEIGACSASRTQMRRSQRKHSQLSYRLLKDRLVSLVRPIPSTAIQASIVEEFRANLYAASTEQPVLSVTGFHSGRADASLACEAVSISAIDATALSTTPAVDQMWLSNDPILEAAPIMEVMIQRDIRAMASKVEQMAAMVCQLQQEIYTVTPEWQLPDYMPALIPIQCGGIVNGISMWSESAATATSSVDPLGSSKNLAAENPTEKFDTIDGVDEKFAAKQGAKEGPANKTAAQKAVDPLGSCKNLAAENPTEKFDTIDGVVEKFAAEQGAKEGAANKTAAQKAAEEKANYPFFAWHTCPFLYWRDGLRASAVSRQLLANMSRGIPLAGARLLYEKFVLHRQQQSQALANLHRKQVEGEVGIQSAAAATPRDPGGVSNSNSNSQGRKSRQVANSSSPSTRCMLCNGKGCGACHNPPIFNQKNTICNSKNCQFPRAQFSMFCSSHSSSFLDR